MGSKKVGNILRAEFNSPPHLHERDLCVERRSIHVECAHPFLMRSQRTLSEKAGAHRERPMPWGRRNVKSSDFCGGFLQTVSREGAGERVSEDSSSECCLS